MLRNGTLHLAMSHCFFFGHAETFSFTALPYRIGKYLCGLP